MKPYRRAAAYVYAVNKVLVTGSVNAPHLSHRSCLYNMIWTEGRTEKDDGMKGMNGIRRYFYEKRNWISLMKRDDVYFYLFYNIHSKHVVGNTCSTGARFYYLANCKNGFFIVEFAGIQFKQIV